MLADMRTVLETFSNDLEFLEDEASRENARTLSKKLFSLYVILEHDIANSLDIKDSFMRFNQSAKIAIQECKPVWDLNLEYKSLVLNILKSIANLFIQLSGNKNKLFSYDTSVKEIKQLEVSLEQQCLRQLVSTTNLNCNWHTPFLG